MLMHIRHEATFRFSEPVSYSIQQLRLTPREDSTQRALDWQVKVPGHIRVATDAYGNVGHLLTLDSPHSELSIEVCGTVETLRPDGRVPGEGGLSPLAYLADTRLTTGGESALALAHLHLQRREDRAAALLDLSGAVCGAVKHVPSFAAPVGAQGALLAGQGCCADIVHTFIACCRSAGLPARFVSGYLVDNGSPDAAPHVWADVWLPELAGEGWVSVDVLERGFSGTHHCRLAIGRDYLDACPVRFTQGGTDHVDLVCSRVVAEQ